MNEDTIILEVMLELAEEENAELKHENTILKSEIEALQAYVEYLQGQNIDLVLSKKNMIDIKKRLN